jgi:signal transduction histidine kinase
MRSIRWKIGLSVFLLVTGLQIALSWFVLQRIAREQTTALDARLVEQIAEARPLLGTPRLEALLRAVEQQNNKWHERFIEIRDASGRLVAATANVPEQGLGAAQGSRPASHRRAPRVSGVQVWERVHPRSRKGHTRIRVADVEFGGYQVRVALTLKEMQNGYWRIRRQLAWGLLLVALSGAAGACWVARRSLAPIDALSDRARQLGSSLEGNLPRTGSRDELDRLAEVLNEMLERIRSQVHRIRRMSADAAHALRTPLATVRGNLEVHLRSRDAEEERALRPALEALSDATDLVNRLLLLESLEANALDVSRAAEVRLDSVAEDVVDALGIAAEERQIELKCLALPAAVRGDRAQLRNLVLNLLDNALRHTPCGGKIEVSVGAHEGEALLVVQDSGPGLRDDQLERVFERFYSERADGLGSGLGLPIARAIAEWHGGSLVAKCTEGARFELRLPML